MSTWFFSAAPFPAARHLKSLRHDQRTCMPNLSSFAFLRHQLPPTPVTLVPRADHRTALMTPQSPCPVPTPPHAHVMPVSRARHAHGLSEASSAEEAPRACLTPTLSPLYMTHAALQLSPLSPHQTQKRPARSRATPAQSRANAMNAGVVSTARRRGVQSATGVTHQFARRRRARSILAWRPSGCC